LDILAASVAIQQSKTSFAPPSLESLGGNKFARR
jgi:hypothetical protein